MEEAAKRGLLPSGRAVSFHSSSGVLESQFGRRRRVSNRPQLSSLRRSLLRERGELLTNALLLRLRFMQLQGVEETIGHAKLQKKKKKVQIPLPLWKRSASA